MLCHEVCVCVSVPSPQPLTGDQLMSREFSDETVGMNIPKNFIPGVEKGFVEVCGSGGWLSACPGMTSECLCQQGC